MRKENRDGLGRSRTGWRITRRQRQECVDERRGFGSRTRAHAGLDLAHARPHYAASRRGRARDNMSADGSLFALRGLRGPDRTSSALPGRSAKRSAQPGESGP
jgi:hypothetical protein